MRVAAWPNGPPLQLPMAMAASLLLHMMLGIALTPTLVPEEKRFSHRAVDVTLEMAMAPLASSAAPDVPEAGNVQPRGSMDLVHTALAPGPPDATSSAQSAPPEPAKLPSPTSRLPPAPRLEDSVRLSETPPAVTPRELVSRAPASITARSPDVVDRVQAPPTRQPARQAPLQASQQKAIAPTESARRGEPSPRTDTASYASQHEAQQDYVLQVVRKLSRARFYVRSAPAPRSAPASSGRAVVVARLTVARDGGLVALSLTKDSGWAGVDTGILEAIRKAAPFAPLPKAFADNRFTFIVPIDYGPER